MYEGSAWYADTTRNSLITVGNGSREPATTSVVLFYNNGQGRYEQQQQLAPGQQMWIDVAQLIRNQVPDKNGRTIPPDVKFGSYELSDVEHVGRGTLFEGKLTIDKTFGHAAYGCANYCSCLSDPTIDPYGFSGTVGTGNQDLVWSDCPTNGQAYDITAYTYNWNASNPSVAGFSGYIGWVDLVGAGFTNIQSTATIDSATSVPYCKPKERQGNGTASGKPTLNIQGAEYLYLGHDSQVVQYINARLATGSPTGGTYQWSSTDTSISFDSNSSPTTHITATTYTGGTNDSKITATYTINSETAESSVFVTKRLFKFLGNDSKILISSFNGPTLYGYRYQASYRVYTNPGGQIVSDGSGIGTDEIISPVSSNVSFNPIYGFGALDQSNFVQDTLQLTSNSAFPPTLNIVNSQDIAVGGFYVRTNTLTYSATGVAVTSNGPYN